MKAKYIIIIAGLGIAFGAVSLWVLITRNRNPKAVAAKFRIGGMIIATASLITAAGCGCNIINPTCYDTASPEVLCYDVPMEVNYTTITSPLGSTKLSAGDTVTVHIRCIQGDDFSYEIAADKEGESLTLQQGSLKFDEENDLCTQPVVIGKCDYKGEIKFSVYLKRPEEEERVTLESRTFTLL